MPATVNDPSRAPSSVSELWAGRPQAARLEGDRVDWCGAVKVDGPQTTSAAACAAVTFIFDHRYSRLSMPRGSYRASDFERAAAAITRATRQASYNTRVTAFVARPTRIAGERLGLVAMAASDLSPGYSYYGAPKPLDGYIDRSVWINPTWSTVRAREDFSRSAPRIAVSFTAQADLPVFDTQRKRDAMVTVSSDVTMTLRNEDGTWKVASFQIAAGRPSYSPLVVKGQ